MGTPYIRIRNRVEHIRPGAGHALLRLATAVALASGAFLGREWVRDELPRRVRNFDARSVMRSLNT
jgi:hypothetical protein